MKNKTLVIGFCWLAAALASGVQAETVLTPKAQLAAESKKLAAVYASDTKLCNDESSASARLQCRRDAKAEYDKALTDAKKRLMVNAPVSAPVPSKAICTDCGKVVSVTEQDKEGESSPLGLIAGGVTGALLGNQVGGGAGKDLATIAGAIGGAYAGKKIEEKVKTKKVWQVGVEYTDGHTTHFEFAQEPGFRVGDKVKNSGASIVHN